MNELIIWFQKEYPHLVEEMKNCSHHGDDLNPYHLEDDVWSHTMLVCKQAENFDYPTKIAALLHDIGKPFVRDINKKGHACFYNHDQVSAFASLAITKELGIFDCYRFDIFRAIALHTQIFKLNQDQITKLFTKYGSCYDIFYNLGTSDHEGRFTTIEADIVPKLETIPTKLIERKECEAVVLIGLPCSGKSTYRKRYPDYEVISWDDTMLELTEEGNTYGEKFKNADDKAIRAAMNQKKQKLINERKNIIFDLTNMSKKSRNRHIANLPACYKKTAVLLLPCLDTINERNEARKTEGKHIPDEVFAKMIKSFFPPSYEEFDEIRHEL